MAADVDTCRPARMFPNRKEKSEASSVFVNCCGGWILFIYLLVKLSLSFLLLFSCLKVGYHLKIYLVAHQKCLSLSTPEELRLSSSAITSFFPLILLIVNFVFVF